MLQITILKEFIHFVDLWITAFKCCVEPSNVVDIFPDDECSQCTGRLDFRSSRAW